MDIENYKTDATAKSSADGIPIFCAHDKILPVKELRPNPKNPNKHPQDQISLLAKIIKATGWRAPITVSAHSGYIVKGHGRYMAALALGLKEAPVDIQEYSTEAEEHADLVADNRLAEMSNIDNALLTDIFTDINLDEIPAELTGYNKKEFADMLNGLEEWLKDIDQDADKIPSATQEIVSKNGDIWILGRHRLICGDCTDKDNLQKLFDSAAPEILLTDPPYCSGGFQESARNSGSKGSIAKQENNLKIANDTLSTRGYQALLKNLIINTPARVLYIFTDWRMWNYLFDVVESSGYGVKNMLVWAKDYAGMGYGWRTQHELILFAHNTKPNWNNHKGYGNILSVKRQQNVLHPTQKPLELILKLLDNTQWARGVFDPFCGSGTTLIACEDAGQTCYGAELEPRHVDTIVLRYITHTGREDVKLIRDSKEQPAKIIQPLLSAAREI